MAGRLGDRVALVTGAGRGIGAEVAGQLAEMGATVLVGVRDPQQAAATAADSAGRGDVRALDVGLDVSSDESVAAAMSAVQAMTGRLDILVNNAAAYVDWSEVATSADLQDAHRVIETNLFGAWRATSAFLPLLRQSGHGRIVNVSSGAGSHGEQQFGLTRRAGAAASYGISKAALNALTSTLATELAGTGILVNAVCPGLTATFEGAETMGARPVADGAASVVWAAALDDDGPTGGFYRDGAELPW